MNGGETVYVSTNGYMDSTIFVQLQLFQWSQEKEVLALALHFF